MISYAFGGPQFQDEKWKSEVLYMIESPKASSLKPYGEWKLLSLKLSYNYHVSSQYPTLIHFHKTIYGLWYQLLLKLVPWYLSHFLLYTYDLIGSQRGASWDVLNLNEIASQHFPIKERQPSQPVHDTITISHEYIIRDGRKKVYALVISDWRQNWWVCASAQSPIRS